MAIGNNKITVHMSFIFLCETEYVIENKYPKMIPVHLAHMGN